ncbi:MAG: ABC transporter ATP-binding protein [Chthonomonadales bacterium]|nr:ABC transporter ATP-binding protein [Chthonomonadales bacterium]
MAANELEGRPAPRRMSEGEVQRRLLAYLAPHRRIILAGLACAAGVAGITALLNWAVKLTITAMTGANVGRLNLVCLVVVGVFVIKGLLSYGQTYFLSLAAQRVTARLRDEVFSHLHSLSLSFFNRRRTGAILSTLTNDIPVIQTATMSIRDIVSAPLAIVFCLALLFYLSWMLTLAAIFLVPLMGLVISRIGKRIRHITEQVQARLADITTILEETVAGVRIIKSFATESHEIGRFSAENEQTLRAVIRGVRKSAQLRPIIEFLGAFGIALVLFLGGNEVVLNARRVSQGLPPISNMDLGGLAMFVLLLQQLARAVSDLGGINNTRQQALAAAERIFTDVLDQTSDVQERPRAATMPPIEGHVVFERVSFSYDEGEPVLREVSFEVKPGEVVALVGHSGAGKSTLVDLIPRFYDVTAGAIRIDGLDVRDVTLESLRHHIGIVPQETWLFAGTLRANIAYGNRDATDEEVRDAAYAANAYFIEGMSARFGTVVGERGVRLSGGERQRIAIARAILKNPRLLILDEATSSLDASSEALVQEALDVLMRGRTTIVIAHRLSTVLGADRILVMDQGRIVEAGTHTELLAAGGLYARLYERQFRVEAQE